MTSNNTPAAIFKIRKIDSIEVPSEEVLTITLPSFESKVRP
jgi:hypothetical protein